MNLESAKIVAGSIIVNGEFATPHISSPFFAHWWQVNDMVITWILNTISDDISNDMNYMDNIVVVWNELNERFAAISGHKFMKLSVLCLNSNKKMIIGLSFELSHLLFSARVMQIRNGNYGWKKRVSYSF